MNAEDTGDRKVDTADRHPAEPQLASGQAGQSSQAVTLTAEDMRLEHPLILPGQHSLIAGIGGLAAITLLLGIAFPVAIYVLNEFNIFNPVYIWMMVMVQSLLLPPMVGFSFAAVTPMFWYGSISLRFAMAIAAVLPGCLGFAASLVIVEDGAPRDFFYGFSLVMFTCLMAIAAVALSTQLWSRWTLSHARCEATVLPPTGIGSMIELTGVAAVGCAVLMSSNFLDYLEGVYLFGGIGFMAAIAIISTQIAFLRDGPQSRAAKLISFAFAFGAAFVLNSFFGVMEYGWDVLTGELILISGASLYGMLLICGLMWVCLRWLRYCGWQCVDRRTARRSGQA